jgi:hypothetical protein
MRAGTPASLACGPARLGPLLAVPAALALLAACGGSAGPSGPTAIATVTASPSASPVAAGPPPIVAVTKAGALEVLNPATGTAETQLVAAGVIGDEVSVSASDTIYFAVRRGCTDEIESVPLAGGTPVPVTTGQLPALSPDGTRLAFASEPDLSAPGSCLPSGGDPVPLYQLAVRTLATGAQVTYPMMPAGSDSGLPAPISHVSWAPDGQHLAVSVASVEDNEGWNLALVSTGVAKYYLSGAGVTYVVPTGSPTPKLSYLREGIYLPDGNLFVSRACCGGEPETDTSRLMWEVSPAGTLVHQVAIGFADLDHDSLAASPDGAWLLYLGGGNLFVSRGGAAPRQLTSGLIAAAFV